MDYLKFYELRVEPFRNDPDVAFFFESRAQRAARMRLLRGVAQQRGLCVLVGAPGLGKTMLARQLLASLDGPERCVRMLGIPHRDCDAGWLMPRITSAFGVTQPAATALGALGQIYERLAGLGAAGRHPVLLVDEAQLLENPRVMEEFRGLLNLENEDHKLLSLVLFGLPDLDRVLRLDEPLAQRVDIRVTLEGLDDEELGAYLEHRLKQAGASRSLFTADAVEALWSWTRGVPRLVNTLADNALFEGALASERLIDAGVVVASAQQLGLVDPSAKEAAAGAVASAAVHVAEPPRPVAPFAAAAPVASTAHEVFEPRRAKPAPAPIHIAAPRLAPKPEPIALPLAEEIGVELEPTLPQGRFAASAQVASAFPEDLEPATRDFAADAPDILVEDDVSVEFAALKPHAPLPPDPEEELANANYADTSQESLAELLSELDDDEAATLAPGVAPARSPGPGAPAPAPAAARKTDDENVDLDALFEDIQIER